MGLPAPAKKHHTLLADAKLQPRQGERKHQEFEILRGDLSTPAEGRGVGASASP